MDTVTTIGRLLVSLAAVLGLMWFIGRRVKKGHGRTKDTRLIDVLGRQQLSRNASVAVVRVGEQALVIGVTDAQVSVLGETDLGAAQALAAAGATPSRRQSPKRTVAAPAPVTAPAVPAVSAAPAAEPEPRGALAGSALSPQTWKQTLESLREMTART